jgi:ribosomal protein S2
VDRRETGGGANGAPKEGKMPEPTMKQLLEAGVHFGHQTSRWNPKMKRYIFGARNGIYIIDLQQTVKMFRDVYQQVRELAASGGVILFVGTKKQAQDPIREEAERCGQFWVNNRWLGGMLTNFQTIKASIDRLKKLEEMIDDPVLSSRYTKKELLNYSRERDKLMIARRHQEHAQAARRDLRHRPEEGRDRGQGSEQAGHPGGRRGRHEL